MSGLHVRVVKVGGSLFDLPNLAERIDAWVESQPPALNVLVAGGGEFADVIRRAEQRFHWSEERSHWLCIDTLAVSARMLAAVCHGRYPVNDWPTVTAIRSHLSTTLPSSSFTLILDPATLLIDHEPHLPPQSLPHNWNVSTDSISARIAQCLHANELVLFKSCNAAVDQQLTTAQADNKVDGHFLQALDPATTTTWVNLRV